MPQPVYQHENNVPNEKEREKLARYQSENGVSYKIRHRASHQSLESWKTTILWFLQMIRLSQFQ